MARSVGAAAAAGLESGLGMGLRLRQQQQQEEDTTRRREREDTLFQQQQEDRTRKLELDDEERQLKALTEQLDALRAEGEGYATQYGGKVPEEIAGPYSQRVREITGTRDSLLRKRYEPIVKRREQELADLSSRLQSGQLDIASVADDDLYRAVVTATKRDPRDLMSVDGQPSRVHQAVTDTMTGLQTKNEGMLLAGVNTLLEPELKVGVGETSPHGGKIVGKRIVKLIPDPRDPSKFMPVLKVYVSKKAQTGGDVARMDRIREQDPDAPDGATGYYISGITKHRSTDPDDEMASVDVAKAMDYAAQMQTFSTLLDHPEIRAKVERAMAQRGDKGDDFLTAFYAVKGKMPTKQVTADKIDLGDRVRIEERDPSGRVTGTRELPKGAAPRAAVGGLAGQIQAVQAYADEKGITEEEAAAALRRQGLIKTPKGAGGGGAGTGLAGPSGGGKREGLSGEELLKTLSPDDARIVKGLVDGTIKQESISTKGDRREKLLALAKQYQADADLSGKKGREVPTAAQNAMLENVKNLERAQRALRLLGGDDVNNPLREGETADKEATGLKGYLPNQLLNRIDPAGVDARAAIAELGSLIIHDRSGAAVTAAEFPRLAPFIPTEKDDAATVRKKLRAFVRIYQEEQAALESAYGEDNGFKPFKVKRPGASTPPDTDRRKSGEVTGNSPAAAPAQPVRTATNPKTGEKLMLKDGQWVPMQ